MTTHPRKVEDLVVVRGFNRGQGGESDMALFSLSPSLCVCICVCVCLCLSVCHCGDDSIRQSGGFFLALTLTLLDASASNFEIHLGCYLRTSRLLRVALLRLLVCDARIMEEEPSRPQVSVGCTRYGTQSSRRPPSDIADSQ
ncbi:hypothetical protein GQ53DRAFT_221840 [Thozetella sp. PMI_491]|nr:hypothetical protein GQ53DRAFT_221840 [Thozetella sp. PMI_491]